MGAAGYTSRTKFRPGMMHDSFNIGRTPGDISLFERFEGEIKEFSGKSLSPTSPHKS